MLISLSLCKLVNVLENVIYMTSSPGGWRKLQLVMSAFNTACNSLAKVEALDTIENMEETPRGARTWYKRLFDLVGIQKKILELCRKYPHVKVKVCLCCLDKKTPNTKSS
jgi:hypothetical protein